MKLASKGQFRFTNFTNSDIVIRIIRHESHSGEFGQLAFIAFLFPLRVPPGDLLLRRAYADDELEGLRPTRP